MVSATEQRWRLDDILLAYRPREACVELTGPFPTHPSRLLLSTAYGFENPSAIQQRAIVPVVKGRDTIAQAQSGTGKTGTFAISILQRIEIDVQECQALILAPTRELAQQIQKVTSAIGEYMKVKVHACVGGTAVREDIGILRDGVHVVVGTPGRVYDMIQRGALKLNKLKLFVLDEADQVSALDG